MRRVCIGEGGYGGDISRRKRQERVYDGKRKVPCCYVCACMHKKCMQGKKKKKNPV